MKKFSKDLIGCLPISSLEYKTEKKKLGNGKQKSYEVSVLKVDDVIKNEIKRKLRRFKN